MNGFFEYSYTIYVVNVDLSVPPLWMIIYIIEHCIWEREDLVDVLFTL